MPQPATPLRCLRIFALALFSMAVAACGNRALIDSSGNLKQLSAAIVSFHETKGKWPDKLDQIQPMIGQQGPIGVIGGGKDYASLIRNPLTGDNPGYEYTKPTAAADISATILLYQLKGGKRDDSLPVAYADGSVRAAAPAATK